MSVAVLTNHFLRIHDERKEQVSSPETLSECSSSPLDGLHLDRFQTFFKDRVYEYKAKIQPAGAPPIDLQFSFPIIPFLQRCIKALQEGGISVKGVYLKGGAVHQIFTGSKKPLADLDVTIEIERPKDWADAEQIIFNQLSDMAGIAWTDKPVQGKIQRTYYQNGKTLFTHLVSPHALKNIFFVAGARKNRILINDETTQFAIYTIPAKQGEKEQDIDLQILAKSPNSCFCSADSIQINLGDLDQLGTDPHFQSTSGYDLQRSLELMKQRKFYTITQNVKTLREGIRGFCRILTRGYHPIDMNFEKFMWESFVKEYQPSQFRNFEKHLENYLVTHYSHDPIGRIFYLLNYYELFDRFSSELKEKEDLKKIILKILHTTPDEIEAIQAYFYLQAKEKTTYRHQRERFAFVKTESSDHLLFRTPDPVYTNLSKRIQKDLPKYHLLHRLTAQNPSHFFQKVNQKPPEPQRHDEKSVPWMEDPHFSLPPEEVERFLNELLTKKEVASAYKHLIWAIEKKGLIHPKFLLSAFQKICSMGSMGVAMKLYRYLLQHKEGEPIDYLRIFSKGCTEKADVQKLIEMISFTPFDFQAHYELIETLVSTVLQKYPELIDSAVQLVKKAPLEIQKTLTLRIPYPDKQKRLLWLDSFHKSDGHRFFDSSELIQLYLDALTSKAQWDKIIDFYQHIESSVIHSPAFAEIFLGLILPACSVRKPPISLITNGLQELFKRKLIDGSTIKSLAILAKYPQILEQVADFFIPFEPLIETIPESPESVRIQNGLKQLKRKSSPKIKVDEKKAASPPVDYLEKGRQFLIKGKYKDALHQFLKIENPSADILFHQIFPCCEELKKVDLGLQILEKAIDLDPENREIWHCFSVYAENAGKILQVFSKLEEKRKSCPKSILIRELQIIYEQKRLESLTDSLPRPVQKKLGAIQLKKLANIYLECHNIEPTLPKWLELYGAACVLNEKYELGMKAFKKSVELQTVSFNSWVHLANLHSIMNQPRESVKVIKEFIARIENDPDRDREKADAYAYLAEYHTRLGEYQQAVESYKSAFKIRLEKSNHAKNAKYAACLFKVHEVDQAIECLKDSILYQLKENSTPPEKMVDDFYCLGYYYLNSRRPYFAGGCFEQAIVHGHKVDPSEYVQALTFRMIQMQKQLAAETDEATRKELENGIRCDQRKIDLVGQGASTCQTSTDRSSQT